VVICQYEKLSRVKHNWKFQLKDGIMNLNGKDFLFKTASGDACWM
jgi:transcription initiation factor TFIIA large subunit